MNTGKSGSIGRAKHRQTFGHDIVSRHVKLAVERAVNAPKKRRPLSIFFSSIADLMKSNRKKKM